MTVSIASDADESGADRHSAMGEPLVTASLECEFADGQPPADDVMRACVREMLVVSGSLLMGELDVGGCPPVSPISPSEADRMEADGRMTETDDGA